MPNVAAAPGGAAASSRGTVRAENAASVTASCWLLAVVWFGHLMSASFHPYGNVDRRSTRCYSQRIRRHIALQPPSCDYKPSALQHGCRRVQLQLKGVSNEPSLLIEVSS